MAVRIQLSLHRLIGLPRVCLLWPHWLGAIAMPSNSLKVPFAHNGDHLLVRVEDAERGQQYFCPSCAAPLVFRKGEVKTPHFAHKASDVCTQETIIHRTAKYLIQQVIAAWKSSEAGAPILKRQCQICAQIVDQLLPAKVEEAVVEYRLASGFIADVALLVGGDPEAAIEIRVTHAVDKVKAVQLEIPFIEVDGEAILAKPTEWTPLVDRFRPLTCPACHRTYQRFKAKTAEISKRTKIELPTSYYRYAPSTCWRCNNEHLVFTWPGQQLHEKRQPTHEPRPATIQFRYSKTINGKYWANTCPHCKALQGDFFLFAEPEEAFFGFHCGQDTPEAFEHDLISLAHYSVYRGCL